MMMRSGDAPREIVAEHGLSPIRSEAELTPFVEKIIATNPEKVAQFRSGKTGLLGFFVGQVMRETQNRAEPKLVQELVGRLLRAE
jgi:glutaminyl-tRNA synthetase